MADLLDQVTAHLILDWLKALGRIHFVECPQAS
jgi:hypothetical protein